MVGVVGHHVLRLRNVIHSIGLLVVWLGVMLAPAHRMFCILPFKDVWFPVQDSSQKTGSVWVIQRHFIVLILQISVRRPRPELVRIFYTNK